MDQGGSGVARLIVKEWQLGLPLHPEFRTLPMVWYVPPLSPITRRMEANCYLPEADEMRIPITRRSIR